MGDHNSDGGVIAVVTFTMMGLVAIATFGGVALRKWRKRRLVERPERLYRECVRRFAAAVKEWPGIITRTADGRYARSYPAAVDGEVLYILELYLDTRDAPPATCDVVTVKVFSYAPDDTVRYWEVVTVLGKTTRGQLPALFSPARNTVPSGSGDAFYPRAPRTLLVEVTNALTSPQH